jgi:hypothetical protein
VRLGKQPNSTAATAVACHLAAAQLHAAQQQQLWLHALVGLGQLQTALPQQSRPVALMAAWQLHAARQQLWLVPLATTDQLHAAQQQQLWLCALASSPTAQQQQLWLVALQQRSCTQLSSSNCGCTPW